MPARVISCSPHGPRHGVLQPRWMTFKTVCKTSGKSSAGQVVSGIVAIARCAARCDGLSEVAATVAGKLRRLRAGRAGQPAGVGATGIILLWGGSRSNLFYL